MTLDPMQPGVAYAIGLLQTDGNHHGDVDRKGRVHLELAVVDEPVLLMLQKVFPCRTTVRRRTRTTNFSRGRIYETATLGLYDQSIRRQLAALGVPTGRKSSVIAPPEAAYSEPDYWRGIVDGDGSVGFTSTGVPFVSLVSASPRLSRAFCDVIQAVCGVERTARPNSRDGVANVMVMGPAAVKLAGWLYPAGAEIAIPRKAAEAARIRNWAPSPESAWRYGVVRRKWTPDEDQIVLTHTIAEAARALARTEKSVQVRRVRLRARE